MRRIVTKKALLGGKKLIKPSVALGALGVAAGAGYVKGFGHALSVSNYNPRANRRIKNLENKLKKRGRRK